MWRIQNPALWAQYVGAKMGIPRNDTNFEIVLTHRPWMLKELEIDDEVNEKLLFRGLKHDLVDKVIEKGFDTNYASLNNLLGPFCSLSSVPFSLLNT